MAKLTVIVHTKNSAATLETCLSSIQELADELIVMDMESTDDTRKIARKFKAKVMHHEDVGYADPARNKALQAATGDWILVVDADEEIPVPLGDAIASLIADPQDFVAFSFPRKNMIFGQWAHTGWWPDYQRRLFKNGHVFWPPQLHGKPQIEGAIKQLPADEQFAIVHHNYENIDQFIDRAQRYSSIAAQEMEQGSRDINDDLFLTWWQEFIRRWFLKEGYQQGSYGQTLSMLQSYFEVLALTKFWQSQNFEVNTLSVPLSQQLKLAAQEARYWENRIKWQQSSGFKKLYWRIRMRLQI